MARSPSSPASEDKEAKRKQSEPRHASDAGLSSRKRSRRDDDEAVVDEDRRERRSRDHEGERRTRRKDDHSPSPERRHRDRESRPRRKDMYSPSPERKHRVGNDRERRLRRKDSYSPSPKRKHRDGNDRRVVVADKQRESSRLDRANAQKDEISSSPDRRRRDGDEQSLSKSVDKRGYADDDGYASSPDIKHNGDKRHKAVDGDNGRWDSKAVDGDNGRWDSNSHRDEGRYNGERKRHDSSSPDRKPRSRREEGAQSPSLDRGHRDGTRKNYSLKAEQYKKQRAGDDFAGEESRRDGPKNNKDGREHSRSSKRRYDDDKKSKQKNWADMVEEDEIALKEEANRHSRSKASTRETEVHAAGKENKQSNSNTLNASASAEQSQGRSGGVYIPPFKLAQMMKEIQDKSSVEYQRITWDALRKSINGLVNKVNASNIKNIIPELLGENLIRGRGLFARSCMKSQMASPLFTHVFAALVAVVNTKFPELGELLLKRIILQFRRALRRNDKPLLLAAARFIAHLVNQQVAHEVVALEVLMVLLENPTDDSVEVSVGFVKECGAILQDLAPQGLHGIFERFRGILHEGEIDKRVQFMIEGLFAIRKSGFQGHPAVLPELDLVDQEDQFTHEISLSEDFDAEMSLDIFKADPNFVENEKKYEDIKKDILGESSSDDDDDGDNGSGPQSSDDDEDDEDDEEEMQMKIRDETETNLVNLRRTIYLTIMSSVDFEEAGHKLLKIKLESGQEMELNIMLLECCSQERTYLRYYGLLGQRFCMINSIYQKNFDMCFVKQYSMIHRLETNKLRNVAKFFAHLLGTDALPWTVLEYIKLTEEDTTSSSRIFIKILFQELSEHLGLRKLNEKLNDPLMQDSFKGIFPKENPKDTRFAINFFTSIGLGGITDSLRDHLKNMPRLIMQQQRQMDSDSDGSDSEGSSGSESTSSGSDSGSSSSGSGSESESESDSSFKRKRRRK